MSKVAWAPSIDNGSLALLSLLVDWDGLGHELHPEAAVQLTGLDQAFFQAFGKHITISEAFRDLPTQVYFWNLYQLGQGNVAAYPGNSSHGEGVAIDINSWVYLNSTGSAEHQWLRANGPRYGWSWDAVGRPSGEPWHWNYLFGTRQIVVSGVAGSNTTPINQQSFAVGDSDMYLIWSTDGTGWLLGANGVTGLSQQEYNLLFRVITSDQTRTPFVDAVKPFTPVGKPGKPHEFNREEIGILNNVLNRLTADDVEAIKNALRTEARPKVYQINDPSSKMNTLAAAVDEEVGYFHPFGSPQELDQWRKDGRVSPLTEQVTEARFNSIKAEADAAAARLK